MVFGSLTPAGLTQLLPVNCRPARSRPPSMRWAMFMGLLTDPFVGGPRRWRRGAGAARSPTRAAREAPMRRTASRARSASATPMPRSIARRRRAETFEPALERVGRGLWRFADHRRQYGAGIEQHATSRIYGVAVGADYRFSPHTRWPASRWPAAAPISASSTASAAAAPTCSRPAPSCATPSARPTSPPRWPMAGRTSPPIAPSTIAGIDQLRAKFNANAYSGRLEGGYRFVDAVDGGIGITPYAAGSSRLSICRPMPSRSSPAPIPLRWPMPPRPSPRPRSELGLRTDKSFAMQNGILTLRGRAAWAHDFNTDRNVGATFQTLPGASFVVNGATAGQRTRRWSPVPPK